MINLDVDFVGRCKQSFTEDYCSSLKLRELFEKLSRLYYHNHLIFLTIGRLIKHTERLLEEKEEKLCIKVLQTLKEMMTVDIDYGEKVCLTSC